MNIADSMDIKGSLIIQKRHINNDTVDELRFNNSIVLTGRELVAKLFLNQSIKPISKVMVGTGTNPVKPEDTTLAKKIFEKKINSPNLSQDLQSTESDVQGVKVSRKKVIMTVNLDQNEANGALTEAGLFTEDNVMYNRVVFLPINKTSDFQLTLIWEIVF